MHLTQLFDGAGLSPVWSSAGVVAELGVERIVHDSRQVRPGDLFCCIPGGTHDGHQYANDAVEAGAAAVLAERQLEISKAPVFMVPSVRRAMPLLAAAHYGNPSHKLELVGVTGTNGKTSVVHLLGSVLATTGRRAGTMGTLSGKRTTAESVDLQACLADWVADGIDAGAMEISSHALAQHRVDGTLFTAVGFTTLGRDHLDFHGSMENYGAAKARLFDGSFASRAVVAIENDWALRLAEQAEHNGMEVVMVDPAASNVRLLSPGISLSWRGQTVEMATGGRYMATNALVAAELALMLGGSIEDIALALTEAGPVPGRFEPVDLPEGPMVVVDYAHTPDALRAVLEAAQELVSDDGRVVVVFGCGGNRDSGKRPEMGMVAEQLADRVVLTSDNPRGEAPEAIINDIMSGMTRRPNLVEPDRRVAISGALALAETADLVVIAGRGHETVQEIAEGDLWFDDRVVVAEEWAGIARGRGAT